MRAAVGGRDVGRDRAARSAALQARTTPGRRRAASVATFVTRACASTLRTTPRCTSPSRVRSSRKRPPPLSRRWSSLRRGEAPIRSWCWSMPRSVTAAARGGRAQAAPVRSSALRDAAPPPAPRNDLSPPVAERSKISGRIGAGEAACVTEDCIGSPDENDPARACGFDPQFVACLQPGALERLDRNRHTVLGTDS